MADRIKGITIEIGGDTTGLSKALSGVNKDIKSTQNQLKDVERLLKLDPTNTKLLEQRQRLLGEAVSETRDKLNSLKDAEKQVQEQFQRGEISQQQYEALQREIISTEQSLDALEKKAATANAVLSKIGTVADQVADKTGNIADKTRGLSAAAGGLVAGLAGAAYGAVTAADDLNTLAKRTGFSTAELQKMKYAADLIDVDMETITGAAAKMKKNMISTSSQVGEAWDTLGISVRDSNGELRNSNDVFYEAIGALSQIENETERDTLAMTLFGKSADSLAGIVDDGGEALRNLGDQAEKAGLIMSQDTLDGLNAVNDQIDELKAKGAATIAQTGAKALEAFMPILENLLEKGSEVLEWVGNLDTDTLQLIITIAAVIAAVSPVFGIISKVASGVSMLTDVIGKLSSVGLLGPAGIIAAVIALVAIVATKGDEIQSILQKVDDFLQGVFATDWTNVFGPVLGEALNAFFANVKNIWDSVKEVLDGIIDFIRGVFTGDWERVWKGVQEIFGGIFNGLAALAKTPINAVIGIINGAINGINKLIDKVNSISFDLPGVLGGGHVGFNIGRLDKLPYLANGGILSSGSAVVGEAGPELLTMLGNRAMVQPLTAHVDTAELAKAMPGGNILTTVTMNVTGDLAQIVRLLHPEITAETERLGDSLVR